MQEKPFYVHIELHKKIVKNAWIISYEERKILVIEFQETVTEDESVAYVFALAKSLKTCKTCKENDCGLCDRTGRLVEDDDQCEKWTDNQTDWRTRMMQTFLAGH